ncbi:E3 ubiquitin-protein ligase Midline-1-like [Lineus longissimus]|uniref:E3 ubiquitin-protein ligase Midline-1-like n=1 Tax=Lineus longissimus TaxID=88925 RepID=UPI00315D07EE
MATHGEVTEATCLVCFEARPLKIVGNCKHAFCTECLSAVLESLDSGSEVLACPLCKVDCPRPWDGVKGLADFKGDDFVKKDEVGVEAEALPEIVQERRAEDKKDPRVIETKCMVCRQKKKEVQAVSLCIECGHFYFCQDCTNIHTKNKATQHHVVTPLHPEDKEDVALCDEHDTDLTSYCTTCGKAVCTICVMLEHGDHAIEDLGDTISAKEAEVRNMLGVGETKLTEMQGLKEDLTHLKVIAPIVDKRDCVIKEIEDHAEKCIDQIIKWKEDLKNQVKSDFKVIDNIHVGLEKVSDVVRKLQDPVKRATQLLTVSTPHPAYLDKLVSMQRDLEAVVETWDDTEGETLLRAEVCELHRSRHSFTTGAMPSCLGNVSVKKESTKSEPQEVFTHTMQVESKDMFIPCVASFGNNFAVAHPTNKGEQSNAIDIYEYPGTLTKTLRDNLAPIFDMSATHDGKLAVLSNGKGGTGCSVKLFNLETNGITSTCDIDIGLPISLGVTAENQYLILGDTGGCRYLHFVDSNGGVKKRGAINTKNLPSRVACGGRCNVVGGANAFIAMM